MRKEVHIFVRVDDVPNWMPSKKLDLHGILLKKGRSSSQSDKVVGMDLLNLMWPFLLRYIWSSTSL